MLKVFCDFHKSGNDNYADLTLSELSDISRVIAESIGDYQERLKEHDKQLYSYSRIEKCNIFNIPVNFDIETTNIKENKSALCYIWQIAIYETVFYGRYIEDFTKFIQLLCFVISSIRIKKSVAKNAVIIYVHNLSYEYQFIRKYFAIKPDSFLNYDKRDIIKFEINTTDDCRIIFRCSYQLTRKPLKKLENSRNVIKQQPIDYSVIRSPLTRLTSTELDYALYDVLVMSYYFDDKFIIEGKNITEIPYTLTGYARNYFKEQCGFKLSKSDDIPENVKTYRKILARCTLNTFQDLQIARFCFQGGFTHGAIGAFNEIHENVYHYDLTSSYPTVLLSEMYPVSAFSHKMIKADMLYDVSDGHFIEYVTAIPVHEFHQTLKLGYILLIRLNNLKLKSGKNECIISYSKILNKISDKNQAVIDKIINGRVHSGDNIEMFITDVDYDLIKRFYTFNVTVLDIFFADFDYLPEVFCKTVVDLYSDKTKLKDVKGAEYEYQLKKVVLNSIYGLNVTDPIPDEYEYDNDIKELTEKLYNNDEIQERLDKYNAVHDKPAKINFYYWGVFCTAYGRHNLISMIDNLGKDYIYSDTDSVFFTGEHNLKYIEDYNFNIIQKLIKNPSIKYDDISPKDIKGKVHILGQWTKERQCNKFVTIGAKRYLEIYDSDFKFTCAGIKPEKLKKFFNEMWRDYAVKHYKSIPKLSEYKTDKFTYITEMFNDVYNGNDYTVTDSGKQSSYFNDNEVSGTIIDYQGNRYDYIIKSSLYLENTSFNLSMFDLSDSIVSLIDQYKIFKKSGVIENEIL